MKLTFLAIAFFLIFLIPVYAEIGGASSTFSTEAKSVSVVRANESTPFTYKHGADLGIYEIWLTTNRDVAAPRIDIQKTMLGADVAIPINARNGSIYKILYVAKSRLNDTSIVNAEIRFKVPAYWIKFQKINSDTITLAKLNKTNWTNIKTTKFAEDEGHFYFRANVTNFSVYTIYGKKGKWVNSSVSNVASLNVAASNDTAETEIKPETSFQTKEDDLPEVEYLPSLNENGKKYLPMPALIPFIIAILLLGGSVAYYVFSNKRLRVIRLRMKWRLKRKLKR